MGLRLVQKEDDQACGVERYTASIVSTSWYTPSYVGRLLWLRAVGFVGHGVGETNDDLKAMLASADGFSGPGILIPTANGELFRWCLENGLRVVQQMTLMDTQPSGPANGVYRPAVLS